MKLDDFTGGVTFDFRDLLEGWAGLATSTIAFLIAPDDVGPFWPRDLRTDQKVPQVLWPAKCNPVSLRDGLLEVVGVQDLLVVLQDTLETRKVWVVRGKFGWYVATSGTMSSSSFGL